jgi:hypothetical protein
MANGEDENKIHSVLGGFESWSHCLRFCMAVSWCLLICGVAVVLAINGVGRHGRVAVEFHGGSTVFSVNQEPTKAFFLLSASQLWADTGLEIQPDNEIRITATGKINLAVHRLVEAALNKTAGAEDWTTADGVKPHGLLLEQQRKPLMVLPEANFGCLLAYVGPNGEDAPGPANPRPSGIQVVGTSGLIHYTDKRGRPGHLFLTINDGVLSNTPQAHQAFVGTQAALDEKYPPVGGRSTATVEEQEQWWRLILQRQRWEEWFDDNIGELLIHVDFKA